MEVICTDGVYTQDDYWNDVKHCNDMNLSKISNNIDVDLRAIDEQLEMCERAR